MRDYSYIPNEVSLTVLMGLFREEDVQCPEVSDKGTQCYKRLGHGYLYVCVCGLGNECRHKQHVGILHERQLYKGLTTRLDKWFTEEDN